MDHSSESDDERGIRHDRFRSERFQDRSSANSSKVREEQSRDRYSSRRYRERSPPRTHKHRETISYSRESKHRHDRRHDKGHHSKSSKSDKRDASPSEKKPSKLNKIEKEDGPVKNTNKLSSLLKNFDKHVEMKQKNTSEIGPVLPPQLVKKVENENNSSGIGNTLGPALPPHLKDINEVATDSESCESLDNFGVALPPHLKSNSESDEDNDQRKRSLKKDSVSPVSIIKVDESVDEKQTCKELENVTQIIERADSDVESHGPALPLRINKSTEFEEMPIGPALPPSIKQNTVVEEASVGPALPPSIKKAEEASVGPALPPSIKKDTVLEEISIGPALPPHLKTSCETESEKSNGYSSHDSQLPKGESPSNSQVSVGPALPPVVETGSYGPALPPSLKKVAIQGPTLPAGVTAAELEELAENESDDDDIVGPLPKGTMNLAQYQLDLRAMQIKKKLDEEKSGTSELVKKREEWMLELPPEKATNLGLGPRSFRKREAPDMSNRSSWTDTPADKLRKQEMALQGEAEPISNEEAMKAAFVQEREDAMDKLAQHNREHDRPHSLLELHQKKLKKKKKKEEKEGKKKERRPFDRNIDLQVNRFDEAQKKAIFKKAQLLDTRFSTGESKYL